jgi:hypothetical protein
VPCALRVGSQYVNFAYVTPKELTADWQIVGKSNGGSMILSSACICII